MRKIIKKKKITPINCEEAASRFNEFIDNYLKGKAKDELIHHIAECRHCFERIEFEQMLKTKVSTLGKISSDNEIAGRKQLKNILSKIYSS